MASKRIHLFEFNDSPFVPVFLKESLIEILGTTIKRRGVYDAVLPIFRRFFEQTGCGTVLDLCSGSGEPISTLIDSLKGSKIQDLQVYLSDISPPKHSMQQVANQHPDNVHFIRNAVDATNVTGTPDHQARTIIAAFHHFKPDEAKKILQDSVNAKAAVFIVEPFPRKLKNTLPFFINSFIPGALNPISSEKYQFLKAIFTYILPLIPLLGWWDTIISALRMYSEEEYREMVSNLDSYQWEYMELSTSFLGAVTVFTGVPRH